QPRIERVEGAQLGVARRIRAGGGIFGQTSKGAEGAVEALGVDDLHRAAAIAKIGVGVRYIEVDAVGIHRDARGKVEDPRRRIGAGIVDVDVASRAQGTGKSE